MGIAIGNIYRRTLGAVKQNVEITAYEPDADSHKPWVIKVKSGKTYRVNADTIGKWEVISEVETAPEQPTVETAEAETQKNTVTCLEAAIQTLIRRNVPMNAKQLVKAMQEDKAFFFKPTAKTPWNSVGTRLATYMKNCVENCRIKCVSRGMYAHADYQSE